MLQFVITLEFTLKFRSYLLELAKDVQNWVNRNIVFKMVIDQFSLNQNLVINYYFDFSENQDWEKRLIHILAEGYWREWGYNQITLTQQHVISFRSEFIYSVMLSSWLCPIERARFDTAGYLDSIIRERLLNQPGYGICYMFLVVAKIVNLNEKLTELIEEYASFQEFLNFKEDELKGLLLICGSRKRLRLAILLSHEFGKLEKDYSKKTDIFQIRNFYWNFLWNSEDKYKIMLEALLQTNANELIF